MKTAESTQQIVGAYAKIARPLIREWMPAASCIASVRTTIEVMRLFRIRATEFPVCWTFQVPSKGYARVSGFSREERKRMEAKGVSCRDERVGWNGHLVVMIEDRWLLDPAIDQADSKEFDVEVRPQILVIDLAGRRWDPRRDFELTLKLITDNGIEAHLMYRRIRKRDYLDTEAWNDEGLPILAAAIAEEIRKEL